MTLVDAVDRDRLVRTFLELVAIDSPTGHEEGIGKELEARFGDLGCEVTKDEIGNLVSVLPGTRDDTMMVSTHMDTAGTDSGIQAIVGDDGGRRSGSVATRPAPPAPRFATCLLPARVMERVRGPFRAGARS